MAGKLKTSVRFHMTNLKAVEMWLCSSMLRIPWSDKKKKKERNDEVLTNPEQEGMS